MTAISLRGRKVVLHDMCLRDGMHPKRHQISLAQMVAVATGLDEAGVPLIEVTHGDGLGGASINYGFPLHTDEEYLRAVVPRMKRAKISALLLPGIGTVDDLRMAADCGVATVRVATHCTEADVAIQHLGLSRKLGLDTVGFLMMAHMIEPEALVAQAKIMEAAGANIVYCTDSAGYMLPADVTARIGALRAALRPETEVGFHGHHNLGMGIANSIAAIEAGAARVDGSAAGLGAGAGNTPLEVFVAVLDRMGADHGIDLYKLMDVAEELVVPMMDVPVRIDRDALILGYAGVYSSFLLFAQRAGAKYGIPPRDLLVELGRRKTVGGQEDLIEDLALDMARSRGRAERS
ncbi:MAG TPA: 4-hydroxy-2-oxovalerate aldolase [Kofleriaceae bacterium]|nr:4-hydroxy-2-oxovalerate aldolase [Kofleriaceae bacterium]